MSSMFKLSLLALTGSVLFTGCVSTPSQIENKKTVTINAVSANGIDAKIGSIELQDSAAGLVIKTNLNNLPSGPHGFHIHENGSCEPAEKDGKLGVALSAGGHYNPLKVGNHGNPLTGHMGDLPLLNVENDGTAKVSLLAPRLKLQDIQGLAVMIHAGSDNYSDDPKPLGGGGDRIACGLIQ